MASRRLFDGAQIELGLLPIVAPPPPSGGSKLWIKVSGVWKDATTHINVAGTWKVATVFFKDSGTWK
jgi:hypothetical protein